MRLFAVGDLHLSGGDDKPMDVFGPQWDRHFDKISANWRELVGEEDTVLIPGDISWAMKLEDAREDLARIAALPGRKVLCKGNHDYWWNSISRVRAILPEGMTALQHDEADLGRCVVCATRGWTFPTDSQEFSPQDSKVFVRETTRLRLALEAAKIRAQGRPVVVMMHFPPLLAEAKETPFTEILEDFGVHSVVYGHLHGQGILSGFNGENRGIRYQLVSCDSIGFRPVEILMEENY